jgi:autotransporter-associated beta strand protein
MKANPSRLVRWVKINSALIALVALASAQAQTNYVWNNAANSTWATTTSWTPNAPAGGPAALDSLLTPSGFGVVTLFGNQAISNITYDSSSSWTIRSSTANSTDVDFDVGGDIIKSGAGTLSFAAASGSSRFMTMNVAGSITLNEGVISLSDGGVRLNASGPLILNGGAFRVGSSPSQFVSFDGGVQFGASATADLEFDFSRSGRTTSAAYLSGGNGSQTRVIGRTPPGSGSTATLDINGNSGAYSFAGLIQDGGLSHQTRVTKTGSNTQAFTQANSYSAGTIISNGLLLANNTTGSATGSGAVQVSGGTLGGSGFVEGAVTVEDGATLLGGDQTVGTTLTLSEDVELQTGSTVSLALGPAGAHSTLARTGGAWTFDANQEFTLIDLGAEVGTYSGIITGLAADPGTLNDWTIANSGWDGTFSYNDGDVDLEVTVIPEPHAGLLVIVGGLCVWMWRRKGSV